MNRLDFAGIARGIEEWSALPTTEAIARRQLLLSSMNPFMRLHLATMIGKARVGRERLLRDYAHSLLDVLMSESRIGTATRPERLLEYAARPGNGGMDRRLRFEALSLFDLALLLLCVEQEPHLSEECVGEDMSRLLDLMVEGFFTPQEEDLRVRTWHKPDDQFRVGEVVFGDATMLNGPEYVRTRIMTFRRTRSGISAMVDHRPKDPFDTAIKMLKQRAEGLPDWERVYDRRGFRFVVREEADIGQLFQSLQEFARTYHATFDDNPDKAQARLKDRNTQSSKKFRARQALLKFDGQDFEIQAMSVRDYVTSHVTLGDENHDLYRLRQIRGCYGELLWPRKIYGIDWQQETAADGPLYEQALAKLGWRASRLG